MTVPRCLIVDYGGVLTEPLRESWDAWACGHGIDPHSFRAMMDASLAGDESNLALALERGEIGEAEFDAHLATVLRSLDGGPLDTTGMTAALMRALATAPDMVGVVLRAKAAGIATALLSNSWSLEYDRTGWERLFDVVVISGEVGMRKPEPAIYLHTAALLGTAPGECVFVDDLPVNVRGAVAVGMVGVHHHDVATTRTELEAVLGIALG